MKIKTKTITECAIFTALLCIFSPISFPVGPVPITLALFAVMLAAVVLGVKKGVASVITYILLGAIGLPVFSGAHGGVQVLLGPTGGYLWSYVLLAAIAGAFSGIKSDVRPFNFIFAFIGCVVGTAVCYICGTLQYMVLSGKNFTDLLAVCVYPFIPLDLVKAVCATLLGVSVRNAIEKNIK